MCAELTLSTSAISQTHISLFQSNTEPNGWPGGGLICSNLATTRESIRDLTMSNPLGAKLDL